MKMTMLLVWLDCDRTYVRTRTPTHSSFEDDGKLSVSSFGGTFGESSSSLCMFKRVVE